MWLEANNLCLNYPSRKLAPKQQGPFEISQVLSLLTYHLHLPSTWKIHDVFHATLLSSYKKTKTHGPNFLKPPPDLIGKEEYEVEWIISHWGTSGHRKYLTTWKGYPLSENTWEPESNLQHMSKMLGNYKWTHSLSYLTTMPCPSFDHTMTPSLSGGLTDIPWKLGLTVYQLKYLRLHQLNLDHAKTHSCFCKESGCPIHN